MALFHGPIPPDSGLWGWGHPTHIFLIFPEHPESWTPSQIPSWGPRLGCTLLHPHWISWYPFRAPSLVLLYKIRCQTAVLQRILRFGTNKLSKCSLQVWMFLTLTLCTINTYELYMLICITVYKYIFSILTYMYHYFPIVISKKKGHDKLYKTIKIFLTHMLHTHSP